MEKPARLAVAAVKTRPEQPEAPSLLVLDPVIIADRIDLAGRPRPPPFVGDPLRPVGAHDPMAAPPPHEPERRVVGQQPERLDRLRRVEQPDRAGWFAGDPPPHPSPLRPRGRRGSFGPSPPFRGKREGKVGLHSHRGAFRNVALARIEPRYGVEPQPVAEPVEEWSDTPSHSLPRKRGRVRVGAGGLAGKPDLLRRQGFDRVGGKDHVFDAEAGIDCVEPLPEERNNMARIAARAGGAEADPLDPAIHAVKDESEPPRSRPF